VTVEHGLRAGKLPLLHKDPFDRLLVAQAQLEGLTIVTRDPRIARYDVATLAA
jgi:PIN domain nuclease of toxin-antitoxin system